MFKLTCSTLMTSAPRSLSNIVVYGPASTLVRSTTFMPLSGGSKRARRAVAEIYLLLLAVRIDSPWGRDEVGRNRETNIVSRYTVAGCDIGKACWRGGFLDCLRSIGVIDGRCDRAKSDRGYRKCVWFTCFVVY